MSRRFFIWSWHQHKCVHEITNFDEIWEKNFGVIFLKGKEGNVQEKWKEFGMQWVDFFWWWKCGKDEKWKKNEMSMWRKIKIVQKTLFCRKGRNLKKNFFSFPTRIKPVHCLKYLGWATHIHYIPLTLPWIRQFYHFQSLLLVHKTVWSKNHATLLSYPTFTLLNPNAFRHQWHCERSKRLSQTLPLL